jgi:glycogen debranching enzyme
MNDVSALDVNLTAHELKERTFLLGNKQAFSLCLPATSGVTDAFLHPHKWFGAYLYGRKFLEGQVVRASRIHEHVLASGSQIGFRLGLSTATRTHSVEGARLTEEFFVPDGVQGIVCTLAGDADFIVEPEFDMRFYRALHTATHTYTLDMRDDVALIGNTLPGGTYDDLTETFLPDPTRDSTHLYAAVGATGEGAWIEALRSEQRPRHKRFRKDQGRYASIDGAAPEGARHDHAPLWRESRSTVYGPIRVHLPHGGSVLYGFGGTLDEAVSALDTLRRRPEELRAEKAARMQALLDQAPLITGDARLDTAYAHVLARLMDALVARKAAAEDTVLDRPVTMILAGNQYFHDSWKRDENIALGFLLTLGFHDLARSVIQDTWQLQDPVTGRLPQRIRAGEAPPYHSSDGTLWALVRLFQYWRCTGDDSLLREKLPMVMRFFEQSLPRCINGLLPSGRTTNPEYLWETWMDTEHTPRHGFPVEIQILWIACLRAFRPIVRDEEALLETRMEHAESSAWEALERYHTRGVLADSLDEDLQVRDLITPNAFFSFGVGVDLGPEVERSMRAVGKQQLAGSQGIMTLAPADWDRVFPADFLNNARHVRGRRMRSVGKFNYHRGVEWNWLAQFFVRAELKYGEADTAFQTYVRPQVESVLERAGIGGISELHDLDGSRGPEYQAWSMSGFLESLHAFAGVRIDVPDRLIMVEPHLPQRWPDLRIRKWYGTTPLDLHISHDARLRVVRLDFPEGGVADANVEIVLGIPPRRKLDTIDIRIDGIPQSPHVTVEPMPGTERSRVRVRLPAYGRIEVVAGLRRVTSRALSA